ncbi:major facilitator superfamily domain-containing protein [Mortierella sp. GBAus27b]|nr:major facilitator superfamily domain-containing protein [Mortierella sp. GBAus27b]
MSSDLRHDSGPPGQQSSEAAIAIGDRGTISVDTTQPQTGSRVRWAILASACLVMFGNYYAFDNPASLNQPLQEYMQMSDDSYAYFINILYTAYSLPNIVLPWLGGYASDKFGHRRMLLSLSAMVALGHLVVCLGVERRHVPAMILGRVLFGAGESLAVTQSAITVKHFRGRELAMALGINLCIARLGSVLNDVLTPYIWLQTSVPTAFWGGFVSCVLSFMTACILVWLDRRYESTVASGFSRLPTHLHEARFSIDTLRSSFDRRPTRTMSASSSRYDPPVLGKAKRLSSEEFGMEVLRDERGVRGSGSRSSSREQKKLMDDHSDDSDVESTIDNQSLHHRQSAEGGDDLDQNGGDNDGDRVPLTHVDKEADSKSLFGHCVALFYEVFDYSQSFWVLFVMTLLLVGVQVPFNSIHAGFLQMRWYHNDPQKAAQIMTVPDLLSSVLILPLGYFVDHYGQKSWLFMLSGLIIGFSHFVLGIIPISTPVPALMALGVASAIGAVITSAIPVLVKSHQIGTAYGLSSSAMNIAFTIFPLIVAKLMTVDPSVYTYVEVFFSCCGFLGLLLAVRLRCMDIRGDLDRREIDNKIVPM